MNWIGEHITLRTTVKVLVLAAFVMVAVSFVIFQARHLIIGPQILIIDDVDGPQNERQVSIAGAAYNISHLWLNGRPIYTDLQGNFKEALVLENGYTVVTLRAEDRYGRTTEVERTLVYSPMTFTP